MGSSPDHSGGATMRRKRPLIEKSLARLERRDGSPKMNIDDLNQAFKAASAGMEMVISILTGCILGYVVGSLFDEGSGYIGLTVGAILGLVLGTYNLYRKYG